MSALVVFLIVGSLLAFAVLVLVFRLGAKAGGAFWYQQLQRTRLEAAQAERQLHNLTRDAFVSMAEHAERRSVDR